MAGEKMLIHDYIVMEYALSCNDSNMAEKVDSLTSKAGEMRGGLRVDAQNAARSDE